MRASRWAWARLPRRNERMRLIEQLHAAALPVTGEHAAEVAIWALPWPGRDAWLREHAGL